MKDRLVPTIDAIVRVCDDIVRTIEEHREKAAGLFAPKKSRGITRLCLDFAFALAETPSDRMAQMHKDILRLRQHLVAANDAIAGLLDADPKTIGGIAACEETLIELLLEANPAVRILAGLVKERPTAVRLTLSLAFSDIRQQLEDAVGCQSSPLPRIAHRIASAVVRFLLPEIRQILKSYGEAQARDAAERRKTSELILWYASGNDPRFKPRDGRQANAIKDHMVREGLSMMAKDGSLSERSAADSLVRKYHGIPGAYTDAETLRRQINRTKNRTSDSDMS